MRHAPLLLLLLALLVPRPLLAAERVGIRVGDHAGHGRLVFDWAAAPPYAVEQQGDRVRVRFGAPAEIDLAGARRLPRNVVAIERVPEGVALTLRPGARLRHFRNGARVAFDALDPSPEEPSSAAAAPAAPRAQAGAPAAREAAAPAAPQAGASPPAAVLPQPNVPAAARAAAELAAAPPPRSAAAGPPPRSAPAAPAPRGAPAAPAPRGAPEARRDATPPAPRAVATAVSPAQPSAPAASGPPASARVPAPAPPAAPPPQAAPASPGAEARDAAPPGRAPDAAPALRPNESPVAAAAPRPDESPVAAAAPRPAEVSARRAAETAPRPPAAAEQPPETTPVRVRLASRPGQPVTLRLPLGADTGAAALRRGDALLLAFDAERPLDLGGLANERSLAGAVAHRVPGGIVLVLPGQHAAELRRDGADWLVTLGAAAAQPVPLAPTPSAALAAILAQRPGRVLGWPDPQTGLPLLLGTVAEAGQRQVVGRGFAAFELPETLLGVAVLARSDHIALRPAPGRFVLSVEGGTALGQAAPAGAAAAAGMSRSFDFPALGVPALMERLRAQQAAVAAAPPLARGAPRLAAAETLVALGLPQEAQAMLRLAAGEDPLSQNDPRHAVLAGMAALLAGRPAEGAAALDAPLPPTDELILWRGVRDAAAGDARRAAPGLAATMPLLLAYPDGLRRRLLPGAAEAMAEGGEVAAARRLIEAAGEDVPLALALGIAEEAAGAPEKALEAYAAAAQGRDRHARARALRLAAELRLATGRLDPAGAARALEQTLFAWRADDQEVTLRARIAELRRGAGDPRGALALLREAEAMFPDRAAALRAPMEEAFLAALATEPPLSAVALHDSHPELMPGGERGEAALAGLADRLAALDLADRAARLLRQAMERAPPGAARASLGLRLAHQRLGERDAEGALAALSASGAPALPPPLVTGRALAAAQAEARRGNRQLAAEALSSLGPAGDEALADILAEARDFAGAAAALRRHIAATLPPAPEPLAEPLQRQVLRQAALLALAGDEPALATLRREHGARLAHRPIATAFEALTSDPARGLADLPRVMRELDLFRALPSSREPLRAARAQAG